MSTIADQLRALADQLDGTPVHPVDAPVPAGFVRVTPTGVRAKGSRLYPDPAALGRGSSPQELNLWGYYTIVTGKNIGPYMFSGAGTLADSFATFPEAVDRMEHPDDWATQADWDERKRMEEYNAGLSWGAGRKPT
jgi:hypothetical protein